MTNEATELTDELRNYLRIVVEEDLDRSKDHLLWLSKNPNEEDRDQQIAECERAIEMAGKAMNVLASEPSKA